MKKHELDLTLSSNDGNRLATTAEIARIVLRGNWFAKDFGEKLYYYEKGIYKEGGERAIDHAVVEIFESVKDPCRSWRAAIGVEVIKFISIKSPTLLDAPELHRINLRNGIYNAKTNELEAHTPDYLTTVQLNVNFDEFAKCPNWDSFIESVFPSGEGQDLGYEIFAWLMTPYIESQKSVVLLGSGANGKSIYLHGITSFLGDNNHCNIPLQKLGDRFTTTLLLGKLANISPDLPNTKIANTSEFKALTGGDYVTAEYKHGGQFKFRPFARCLFACNELPDTPDASDGFYRRLNIIEFEKKFKENPELGRKLKFALTTESELSGLFNKCLVILPKIWQRGISITEKMKHIVEEHRKENDPVAQWLDENTVEDPNEWIIKQELFIEYQKSGNIGKASKNQMVFGRSVRRYRPSIVTKQRREDGLLKNVYEGIRLKTEAEDVDWQSSDDGLDEETGFDGIGIDLDGIENEDQLMEAIEAEQAVK